MSAVTIGVSVACAVVGVALVGLLVWRCVFIFKQDRALPPLSLVDAADTEQFVMGHKDEWLEADAQLFGAAPTWHLRKSAPVDADGINLTVRERSDPSGNANNLFWYYAETTIPIGPRVAAKLFGSWVREQSCAFQCCSHSHSCCVDSPLARVDQRGAHDAAAARVPGRLRGVGAVHDALLPAPLLWGHAASARRLLRHNCQTKWRCLRLVPLAAPAHVRRERRSRAHARH